jgi:membrane protease YdiL (CAAX protease family)
MMLNSPAWPNQVLGGLASVILLIFAFASLGKLRGKGMDFADWKPASGRFWFWAGAPGVAAGTAGLMLSRLAHQRINVAYNWRVFLLQVALGPVLEEVLFRGYLMRLLLWVLRVWKTQNTASTATVLISATV